MRRGTHEILRPNYTISQIRGPLPRPDGSIPALHEDFLRPAQRTILLAGANPRQKVPQVIQPCGDPPCGGATPAPTPPPGPDIVVVTKYEKTYGYKAGNYRETYVNGNLFSQHYLDGPMNGTSFPYRYAAGGHLVNGTSPGLASIQSGTTYTIGSATLVISSQPGGTLTDNRPATADDVGSLDDTLAGFEIKSDRSATGGHRSGLCIRAWYRRGRCAVRRAWDDAICLVILRS